MKIEAVIFDLFGTLVNSFTMTEYKAVLKEMSSALDVRAEVFTEYWSKTFIPRAIGEFKSVQENIIHICDKLDVRRDESIIRKASEIREEYTKRTLIPKPGALEILETVRKLGYKTGLISDCSCEVPQNWDETPFAPLFDVVTFSCVAGIKKPNIGIYRLACKKLFVSPSHCLYVGDGSSNELSGAFSAGMYPVWIQDPDEPDAYRVDKELWGGEKINRLMEVATILEKIS